MLTKYGADIVRPDPTNAAKAVPPIIPSSRFRHRSQPITVIATMQINDVMVSISVEKLFRACVTGNFPTVAAKLLNAENNPIATRGADVFVIFIKELTFTFSPLNVHAVIVSA